MTESSQSSIVLQVTEECTSLAHTKVSAYLPPAMDELASESPLPRMPVISHSSSLNQTTMAHLHGTTI